MRRAVRTRFVLLFDEFHWHVDCVYSLVEEAVYSREQPLDTENFCEWARLIQAEYMEMPGLRLSKRQAQRLWSLDAKSCDLIFSALEAAHFLKRHGEDSFMRADAGY